MCGVYITNLPKSEDEILSKLNLISFRGPDNLGYSIVKNISIGHLRLSILDLDERSNQPMDYRDVHITYNGEIYNYLLIKEELLQIGYDFTTESDTEVILKGYYEWGVDLFPKLNGMFACAIFDARNDTIICFRDRVGVKPLYYYWNDGDFEMCSQLKPISEGKEILNEAISLYLDCTYIPSPLSIYKDVFKLPPGNFMIIDLNKKNRVIKEYWNLKKIENNKLSYTEAKDKVHELLKDSVKIRMRSDVPFGSFLSGGIDSALVSSIASKYSDKALNTFSVGFIDSNFDESKIAKEYAKIIGSNHTQIVCTPKSILEHIPKLIEVYDEPFADSSALPTLLLNAVTKKHVTVALSGDGGDESFLGYNYFHWIKNYKLLSKIPYFFRYIISFLIIDFIFGRRAEIYKSILRIKSLNDFIEKIFVGHISLNKKRDLNTLNEFKKILDIAEDPYQKAADYNIKLWLENDSNVKVDRASMAYSVEIRSPFLDFRIIEMARNLPIDFRIKNGERKKILKDILKEYIPEEIFNQPKKGFSVPMDSWIRNELREEIQENLTDFYLEQLPNFNISKFKKMYKEHMGLKRDNASFIWRVYVLVKWLRKNEFIKNEIL